MEKELSRSEKLAAKVLYSALVILKEVGGTLPSRDVVEQVEKKIQLSEWDNSFSIITHFYYIYFY